MAIVFFDVNCCKEGRVRITYSEILEHARAIKHFTARFHLNNLTTSNFAERKHLMNCSGNIFFEIIYYSA